MFKYRVGLNEDAESNSKARDIEEKLKDGKTVKVRKLSGTVEAVAWPCPDGFNKDRTGYSILLMDNGNFFSILFRVIMSHILNKSYVEFGWGNIEITDE